MSAPFSIDDTVNAWVPHGRFVIDPTSTAYSTNTWTVIPGVLGQSFHQHLDTHSSGTWTLIPVELGQI